MRTFEFDRNGNTWALRATSDSVALGSPVGQLYSLETLTGVYAAVDCFNALLDRLERAELADAQQRIRELEQQSAKDALDGQAALDEANNRIRELEAERDTLREQLENAAFMRGVAETGMATAIEREALLVAEVRRCWELAQHGNSVYCDAIKLDRPAEVRAIVEG